MNWSHKKSSQKRPKPNLIERFPNQIKIETGVPEERGGNALLSTYQLTNIRFPYQKIQQDKADEPPDYHPSVIHAVLY